MSGAGPEAVPAPPSDGRGAGERLHVVTVDPDRATEVFRRGFPGIRLHATKDGPDFRFDYRRVSDGRLTVNRLRVTGSAEGVGSITDVVAVGRLRDGHLGLEYGREAIDTTAPYLRPSGPSGARMEDVAVELTELDPGAFFRAAARYLEGTGRVLRPPSPTSANPVAPALAATWRRIGDHLAEAAADPEAFASPLVRTGLFDLAVAGMLETFPLTVAVGTPGGTGMQASAVRRAVAYIEEHLAEPIDVPRIASAARVSVRGLQAAFRRELGVTPVEHLRLRRLAAAREELARADAAGGVTVASIARGWGFAHLSRFSQWYRKAYGESPSQTLHR
ncbi:MAG: helix-turn-helix domain-containing protein [Amnibacterium sp.]